MFGIAERFFAAIGGDHDDGRCPGKMLVLQFLHGLDAIHAGHLPVHQHQVIGQLFFLGIANHLQGVLAVPGSIDFEAEVLGHAGEDFAGRRVVINHQYAYTDQLISTEYAPWHGFLLQAEVGVEVKTGAFTRLRFNPDAALHEFDEVLGDGQPQPGATVFAGGRGIDLAETLEHFAALFGRHADAGIPDPEVQLDVVIGLGNFFNANDDFAGFGKFDGVIAQVNQNLPQPQGVADQRCGNIGGRAKQQLQSLVFGFHANQVGQVVHDIFEVEVGLFHRHLAGFDFGEVEDVVDDAQEVLARSMHFRDVVLLLLVEIRL